MAILTDHVLADIIIILLGCVTIAYLYFQRAYNHWKRKGVVCLQPTFPIGSMKDVVLRKTQLGVFFHHCSQQFPGERHIGLYILHKPILLLKDPDIIKQVLTTDFQTFHDHNIELHEDADPLWSRTLILLRGQRWKQMRAKLTPVFSPSKLKKMVPLLAACTQRLKTYLHEPARNNQDVDMKDVTARFATDVIGSCAFGIDCDCLNNPNSEFRLMGKKLLDPPDLITSIKFSFMVFAPGVTRVLKLRFVSEKISNFFRSVFMDTMRHRKEHRVRRNDFVDLLMQMKMDDEESCKKDRSGFNGALTGFTDDDIMAQALAFFIAGFETSSTAISMALYELALNPSYQEELQEEIDKVLAKHNRSITFEAIQEMTYLDMVVQETLRKHPPVLFVDRRCNNDYRIQNSDVVIEKGTVVYVPIYALHHDPTYYPNPDEFNPERFSKDSKQCRPGFAFLPFNEGPRNCIGMKFGLLQTKMGLISVLSEYKVHKSQRTEVPIAIDPGSVTFVPKNGVWLKISPR